MSDYILKDQNGNKFISIAYNLEEELSDYEQLTHCLVIVKIGDDYLLGWNKWRNRWEIFGGCMDDGESPRACIVREGFEELGILDGSYVYIGLMKFLIVPDYFSPKERIEYGGLYGITLQDISIDNIYNQIQDRDEITKLALYSKVKGKEPIAPIDEKLLEYY